MEDNNLENNKKPTLNVENSNDTNGKVKKPANKKKIAGLITFSVGIVALIAGLVFLLLNIFAEPGLRDAEYLVEVGKWAREGSPSVIWDFTEIGKGRLTTNNFTNEYDFIWAIDDDKLKIETKWLYTLNDNYTYELDRISKSLTLSSDNEEFKFIPLETEE